MISKVMQEAVYEQTNKELYAYYLYLSMATRPEDKYRPGFGKWLHGQQGEGPRDAVKLYDHLIDRGGRVMLKDIAPPETAWESSPEVFTVVQEHEANSTASTNALVEPALKEND